MDNQNKSTLHSALALSTFFGFVILIFDFFLLLIHRADLTSTANFWINVKYLIWAIGVYYALKWYQVKNLNPTYFSYIGYALLLAVFVSLFDIFFYLLYTQVLDPNIKSIMIGHMIAANQQVWNSDPTLTAALKEELTRHFSLIFSFSLWLSYIFLFLFYSVFFAAFIKLTQKSKK